MSAPVIYGKHPGFGDFLTLGLEHQTFLKLDAWLEASLPKLKAELAEYWEAAWAAAPPLQFWMGPEIIGAPLCGMFYASRDKVGRRYPLIFALTGPITPPPVHKVYDDAPYQAIHAHVAGFQMPQSGPRGAVTLLDGFSVPELQGAPFEADERGALWGSRKDGDLARLLSDARATDADKAQMGRTHWWHPALPDRSAGWLGVNGLPDSTALRWLLTDRVRQPSEPPAPQDVPEVSGDVIDE